MHTPLCGHAVGEPRDYVDAAAANGIDLITFTCHIPMADERFAQSGIRMAKADLPRYRNMIEEARRHGETVGVEVLYGIEAEIHPDPGFMESMDEILAKESFDFVLGSLHPMLPAFTEHLDSVRALSDREKIEEYFSCLSAGARSGRYHSLSHPDVIRVYGTLEGAFVPEEHEETIKAFLDEVAQAGVCMEINTSGLIKGDYVVHPDPLIMQWALEREIPFTMGSDSHTPERVGHPFDEVLESFRKMGLRRLHYFRKGRRRVVSLTD